MYKHSNDNYKKKKNNRILVSISDWSSFKTLHLLSYFQENQEILPPKQKVNIQKNYLNKHIYWYTVLNQDSEKKLRGCQNVKFSVTFIGHDRQQLFSFLFGTRQGIGSELVNVSIVPGGKSSFMTRWSEACHVDMEIKSEMTHSRSYCLL